MKDMAKTDFEICSFLGGRPENQSGRILGRAEAETRNSAILAEKRTEKPQIEGANDGIRLWERK